MSELLGHVPPAPGEGETLVTLWTRYANHVKPPASTGLPACGACCDAASPRTGCDDGVALYNVYALARIA